MNLEKIIWLIILTLLYIVPVIGTWYFISKSYYHPDGEYYGEAPLGIEGIILMFCPLLNIGYFLESLFENKPGWKIMIWKRNWKKKKH